MKTTANNERIPGFGQNSQDVNHSMTNAAVKERLAQAFIQQRMADKAIRNASQDTSLDKANLTRPLDSQPVLPVKAPTSIVSSIASKLRNAAPNMPKIDLHLPGLSATVAPVFQSSRSLNVSKKEHNSAGIGANLAPCGVLDDSFEDLFAKKQRPSLVRRHSDSSLLLEPNGSYEISAPGALLVDFPSKRINSMASRRSSSLPDVVNFATDSSLTESHPVLPVNMPAMILASITSTLRNAAPKVPKIDLPLPGFSATVTTESQSCSMGHQDSKIMPHENSFVTKQRPKLGRRHFSDSTFLLEPNESNEFSVPGALLVDFPSKRNTKLAPRRRSSLSDVMSLASISDEDTCSEVGVPCKRSSSVLNDRGGLKISWDLFPSSEASLGFERQGSDQTRLVDGLEYLAPGRRGSVMRMVGGDRK